MTRLQIFTLKPAHLARGAFEPRSDQQDEWRALLRLGPDLMRWPSWAFIERGRVVGAGGLMRAPACAHVAEAWSVMGTPSRAGYARIITWAKTALPMIAKAEGLARLETRARADVPGAAAVLERIGFTREGWHPNAGPCGAGEYSYGWVLGG